jgi:sigma-B regulation protein RsbU (phosphoserine phosphatase)
VLLGYTDGVTEAFNREQEAFGEQRLLETLKAGQSPEEACRALMSAVHAFAAGAEQSDDITVLVVALDHAAVQEVAPMSLRFAMPDPHASLHELLAAFDARLAARGASSSLRHDARLLVEEVASNAIRHGGALREPGGQVRVECEPLDDGLRIDVFDTGVPFDPLARDAPDVDADLHERPVGGLGVHLVCQIAARVSYARHEPFNVLSLVLTGR